MVCLQFFEVEIQGNNTFQKQISVKWFKNNLRGLTHVFSPVGVSVMNVLEINVEMFIVYITIRMI
jgi:hypothetical protein